jgi:dynein heavy chain
VLFDADTGVSWSQVLIHFENVMESWSNTVFTLLNEPDKKGAREDAGPDTEYEYWRTRLQRLNDIAEHLKQSDCQLIIAVLWTAKSSTMKRWTALVNEMTDALNEAKDNVKYLTSLEKYTECLYTGGGPPAVMEVLPALVNNIKMMVTIARYYGTPERMMSLFTKIANQMIRMCKKYVLCPRAGGREVRLWDQNSEPLILRLESCIRMNEAYQQLYHAAKEKLAEKPKGKQFDFKQKQIFGNLDQFCKRAQKLIDMFTTIVQFRVLASHNIDGMEDLIKGFFNLVEDFKRKGYDLLGYDNNAFDRDFLEFNVSVGELETNLQAFINSKFENIHSTEHALELLSEYKKVIQRESLRSDLDSKHVLIFHKYGQDLLEVQKLYDKQKPSPPVIRNAPPVSGSVIWARHLLKRIEEPMRRFQGNETIMKSKESRRVVKMYNKIARALVEYETLWQMAWARSVEASKAGLQAALVVRHPRTGKLFVNFDHEILQLIREAKTLQRMQIDIPESARMVLLQEAKFKDFHSQLKFVLHEHARVTAMIIPVIRDILAAQIENLDSKLQPGISTLTWQSMNIETYIGRVHSGIQKFEELLHRINELIEHRVEKNLKLVSKTLLVDIAQGQTFTLDQFVSMQEKVTKTKIQLLDSKNLECELACEDLIAMVRNSPLDEVEMDKHGFDKAAAKLRAHYSRLMYLAILNATQKSFYALKTRLSSKSKTMLNIPSVPVFDINVELSVPSVAMNPSLEEIQAAINRSAVNVLKCSKRICQWGQDRSRDINSLQTFHSFIAQDKAIVKMVLLLTGSIEGTKKHVHDYLEEFMRYSHLWKADKHQAYMSFMKTLPSLEAFDAELKKYMDIEAEIMDLPNRHVIGCIGLEAAPVKESLRTEAVAWRSQFASNLHSQARDEMNAFAEYMKEVCLKLDRKVADLDDVREVMAVLRTIRDKESEIDMMIGPIEDKYALLRQYDVHVGKSELEDLAELRVSWRKLCETAEASSDMLSELHVGFKTGLTKAVKAFVVDAVEFRQSFVDRGPMVPGLAPMDAADRLSEYKRLFAERKRKWDSYVEGEMLFGLTVTTYPELEETQRQIELLDKLYGLYVSVVQTIKGYGALQWIEVVSNIESMTETASQFQNQCKRMPKQLREWNAYEELRSTIDNFFEVLPLLQLLSQNSMRLRHWEALMRACEKTVPIDEHGPHPDNCKLQHILDLGMLQVAEDVEDITGGSSKELQIEAKLDGIEEVWTAMDFTFQNFKNRGPVILEPKQLGEIMEALEDSQMQLGSMASNRYSSPFRDRLQSWIVSLSTVSDIVEQWIAVQNLWVYMEAVFSSGDIAKQLPQEAKRYNGIDKSFMKITAKALEVSNCVECCCGSDMMRTLLPHLMEQLELCQKSLTGYLETKRSCFPRFYFVSDGVLLEILSQGSDPHAIVQHLQNVFDSLAAVTFEKTKKHHAISMVANDAEEVTLTLPVELKGNVEDYLADVVRGMQETLQDICRDCAAECEGLSGPEIITRFPAQICILALQFSWTADNEEALLKTRQDKGAMSACNKKALAVLNELIGMTVTDLSKLHRTNVETLITIQVHQKDICDELLKKRVRDPGDFEWQKQARFYWRDEKDTAVISICDVDFDYCYEYLGCKERLVITPLTDRCYITLSQAIGMFLGGAPAGPAGTGKTETTKDMGRTLGIFVVVFNCSDQMDYKALGKIYKGLAMAGCWGCFDEFNRIDLDVLSVAAQQVACVLTAQRERRSEFVFTDGQTVVLRPGCSYFITMNPGYAGRQELPQNLKSLFRGVCMMVPDFGLIMRVKLASCGYYENQAIAKKFDILYNLCKQQLSKQTHYDYGLRNILSVLRTAGTVKRQALDAPEMLLMMRTLRDMNLSKLVAEDVPLFLSLIADLFPNMQAEKATFPEIEAAMRKCAGERGLQYDLAPGWASKCIQLLETYYVRHGIGVVGPTGAGKTTMMETLAAGLSIVDVKHVLLRMNPKAITAPQMFGKMDATTGDWTDGVFAVLWRKGTKAKNQNTWIVLDGPVDAIWIENLNTVLDDNKLLTLANGDRIPMSAAMKAFFEPENLANASPATVSRMGIIYVSISVLGWEPLVPSWLATRREKEATVLETLIQKYIPTMLAVVATTAKSVMYSTDGIYVTSCFKILEEILAPSEAAKTVLTEVHMERVLMYAVCWSIGALLELDNRVVFDEQLRALSDVAPPSTDTTFEYFVDESGEWAHWSTRMTEWIYPADHDPKFAELLIPTLDSIRYESMLAMLVPQGKPVLFTGGSGVSKTANMLQFLTGLDRERYTVKMTPFSFVTTPEIFQRTLESCVEKRQGRTFGPPGGKKCALFIDDVSMPLINSWGDQITNEIVRQALGESGIYSLDKPGEWKNLVDLCYTAAMVHPGGGRNDIPNRLKRQFCLFNVNMPSLVAIDNIFGSIIRGRLPASKTSESIAEVAAQLTDATIRLWKDTSAKMLPTPAKFHYQFNMRELSRVFAGVFEAPRESIVDETYLLALWRHECERVFSDKLTNAKDKEWENNEILRVISDTFGSEMASAVEGSCYFVNFLEEPTYDEDGVCIDERPKLYKQVQDVQEVRAKALEFQVRRNEETKVGKLELVLFEYALEHLMRISRVISMDRGSMMLVGVGGSGKQSLTRLASYIAGNMVFQITITKSYSTSNLFDDVKILYRTAGVKGQAVTFIFSDAEVKDEGFLEYVNQILATGEVSNLFAKDEIDGILNDIRPIAKKETKGFIDTADNLLKYFMDRVRNNLHVVLCMSPVGDTLASRARKFPGIINCVSVDWFLPWPAEGLQNVSEKFIAEFPMATDEETKQALMAHMAKVHSIVQVTTVEYFEKYRRNVYVTPKSYLSFLNTYCAVYTDKHSEIKVLADKINNGLAKLLDAQEDVAKMKVELAASEVVLADAAKKSAELLKEITASTAAAEKTKASVKVIADAANEKATTIGAEKAEVEQDLEAAKPALIEAEQALNAIKPDDIKNLKALKNPPVVIKIIFDGVLLLRRRTMIKCTVVEEKGTLCYKDNYSDASKMMNEASFLTDLQGFPKEEITDEECELLAPYVDHSLFTVETAAKASGLAVGLCKWVKAMVTYHTIAKVVIPKVDALRLKEAELALANKKLTEANAELQDAQDMLDAMQARFDAAMAEKQKLQDETDLTKKRMDAANALISGLAGEKIRWTEQSAEFADEISRLVGDCALACAFMSYCGPFNKTFRDKLVQDYFIADMIDKKVAFTRDLSLIEMLTNDAVRGEWNLQGLPTDDLSVQNGILTTRASRYPIMVDPQGQGLSWTRAKESQNGLVETNSSDKAFRNHLEECLSFGKPMLLANVEEELDPLLDAVLDKAFVRKGKQCVIQLGDKEVDVEPDTFQLFITSRIPNPHFTPELSARVTVIDFTVTMQGLEDQLLARVVSQEKPELQEERQKLLEEVNAYKKKIMELQDDLLFRLANCTGSLLDDPEIIDVLNVTKKTSADVQEKLRNARDAELRITTACEEFRPVANRGSVLYFLIAEMNAIDVMYQTSLAQFIKVFQNSMLNSPKAAIPAKRIGNIIEELTFSTFLYIGRGLFEKHKEVFALLLALKVQLVAQAINQDHFDCFLKGGAALDIAAERKKPKAWLPDMVWLNCIELSRKLPVFKDLPELISRNEQAWQHWYDQEAPESTHCPEIADRLDKMHKLLLIRSMRMDRTMIVAHEYISDTLGTKYVDSHPLNIEAMHAESTERTPFICILSMGSDPTDLIMGLAKKKKKEVQSVSMGQGQEVIARRYVASGVANGSWVLLQNTHLGLKYLLELEDVMAKLDEIDPEFRVWVTAEPHPKFPIGLLQMSIKFTNEAPVGMKAGMKRSYAWINQDMLDIVARPEWKTLLWILCHAHSVVQERRKYGAIGWTVPYEFNQSDLNASCLFLQNHLLDMDAKKAKEVTWSTIRYMISEIQYGGRITDDWDRRQMNTFAEKFFQQSSLEPGSELHPGYTIPSGNDIAVYRAAIENSLPEVDSPEVFGLNLNADLQFRTSQAGEVFDTIMETQPKGGGGGAGKSREEVVTEMCLDLLAKLPKDFSKDEIRASLTKMGPTKPINVCFRQETDVLQRSLSVVRRTLQDLQLAMAGTIVMSDMLADALDSLVQAKVPQAWLKGAWVCSSVGVWFQTLLLRYEQFDRWLKVGRPKSFWLPGFSNGQGFLTAMMQEVARSKSGWALDDVVMFTEVTKMEEADVREPPADGIYVHGLFLEGAAWNKKEQHLIDAPPKVLVAHLPVMYITGVLKSQKKVDYLTYECPVYFRFDPRKRGMTAAQPNFMFAPEIRTVDPPSKWILRGVALLTYRGDAG